MSTGHEVDFHTPGNVAAPIVGGVQFQPSSEQTPEPSPNLDADPTQATPPLATANNEAMAVMLVLCGLFVGALALYVVYPAVSSLLGLTPGAGSVGF